MEPRATGVQGCTKGASRGRVTVSSPFAERPDSGLVAVRPAGGALPLYCCECPPQPPTTHRAGAVSGDRALSQRIPARLAPPRDLLRGVRQSARQARGVRARRPRRGRRHHAATLLRPATSTASSSSTSAAAAAADRTRSCCEKHHPAPGRGHGAPARGARHRALAGLRRILGQHACRWSTPRRYPERVTRAGAARHLHAAPAELRWFYQHGASEIFPDRWEALPAADPGGRAR